jgi:hypothetical protein
MSIVPRQPVGDGFRESISEYIVSEIPKGAQDSYGSDQRKAALTELAAFVRGLPLDDARLAQLLRCSGNSDRFEPSDVSRFFALCGLDQPAPDASTNLNELILECQGAPPRIEGVPQDQHDSLLASNRQLCDEVATEQDRVRKAKEFCDGQSQEMSDLRGRLNAVESGRLEAEVESLRRSDALARAKVEELEAALSAKPAKRKPRAKVAA